MARINHIALKVTDLQSASRFYEQVFGFRHVNTVQRKLARGNHVSRHLTDGYMDLTLIYYESENAEEADLAGSGPCIHHFGIEVDDPAAFAAEVQRMGGEIVSAPGVTPIKFRAPGGPIAEVVPPKRYDKQTLAEGVHGEVLE
ncbi:MAG: VOC family protein [Gammaproteobacteria bacterium]|nr:VOC family protein [Gammaproteobacteria bacterium]